MRTVSIWMPATLVLAAVGCAEAPVDVVDEEALTEDAEAGDELDELDEADDGDDGDDGEDDPADEGQDELEPFASDGDWQTMIETMSFDDCNMGEWVTDGPGSLIEVEITGENTFELTHSRATEVCTVEDESFTCEPRIDTDTTPQDDYGLDAVIELEMTAYGTFRTSMNMEWHTAIEADCDGGSCWLVSLTTSSFPCDMEVYVEAQAL